MGVAGQQQAGLVEQVAAGSVEQVVAGSVEQVADANSDMLKDGESSDGSVSEASPSLGPLPMPPTVSPPTQPLSEALPISPPMNFTDKAGKDYLQKLRDTCMFLGGNKYMEELIAMALLENVDEATSEKPDSGSDHKESLHSVSRDPPLKKRPRSDSETQYMSKYPELNYFDNNTECSICFEPFFHPIRLECGHTFCKPCLEQLVCAGDAEIDVTRVWAKLKEPSADFRIKCPNCRQDSTVTGKMPILGVLCKELHPGYYSDRRRRTQMEFDLLLQGLWKDQKACNCTIS